MRPKTTRPDIDDDELVASGDLGTGAHEAALVEQARHGDREAFGELVQRYERRLLRVIEQFVRDADLADDLTQDTFLRAYQRLGQFDPSRRFGPWLFRIGVNLTLDYLRQRKRRGWWSLFSEGSAERSMDPSSPDPRESTDLQQEVQEVLSQIPETYRTVLVLRDLENFSTSEIAAILQRKEPTIRWRLAEARHRFAEIWGQRSGRTIKTRPGTNDSAPSPVSPGGRSARAVAGRDGESMGSSDNGE